MASLPLQPGSGPANPQRATSAETGGGDMVAQPFNMSAFIGQLLAPLPDGEEAVNTPKFRRTMELDLSMPWRKGMRLVELADARHIVAAIERELDRSKPEPIETYRALLDAKARQCLIPAPTAKELRWKLRLLPSVLERPEVVPAIKVDQARFGEKGEA